MMRHSANPLSVVVLIALLPPQAAPGRDDRFVPEFERDVRPILQKVCFKCHGSSTREADLDLRTRDNLLRGGESGNVIVPGRPAESLLLQRIVSGEMPSKGPKLSAEQTRLIERWIESGARLKGEDRLRRDAVQGAEAVSRTDATD